MYYNVKNTNEGGKEAHPMILLENLEFNHH